MTKGYSKSPRLVLNWSEKIDLRTHGKLDTIEVQDIIIKGSRITY